MVTNNDQAAIAPSTLWRIKFPDGAVAVLDSKPSDYMKPYATAYHAAPVAAPEAPIYQARHEHSSAWQAIAPDYYKLVDPKFRRIVYAFTGAAPEAPTEQNFAAWLQRAYKAPIPQAGFTISNMAAAYEAGQRASTGAAPEAPTLCQWPTCQPEAVQQQLAKEVVDSLYGAAAEAPALTLDNAPEGTLAPSIGGGRWYRTAQGWKWNGPDGSGGTFPMPGGDWSGKLVAPEAPANTNTVNLTPSAGLSESDITKLSRHGAEVVIREKNATIKAHQSVLAERDAEIARLSATPAATTASASGETLQEKSEFDVWFAESVCEGRLRNFELSGARSGWLAALDCRATAPSRNAAPLDKNEIRKVLIRHFGWLGIGKGDNSWEDDVAAVCTDIAALTHQSAAHAPDPVVEANRKLLLERSRVGLSKYGVTLANSTLSLSQVAQHALEEALDLANYLQTIILNGLARQAAPEAPTRTKLHENRNEDGDLGWYFDCDGHYIDVERDKDGKYSVFFRNRADQSETWLDQADSTSTGAAPEAPTCTCPSGNGSLRWPCPQHPPGCTLSLPIRLTNWEGQDCLFDADNHPVWINVCRDGIDAAKEIVRIINACTPHASTGAAPEAPASEQQALQSDIRADYYYLQGLRAGWNLSQQRDVAGFNAALVSRQNSLDDAKAELRATPAATTASADKGENA